MRKLVGTHTFDLAPSLEDEQKLLLTTDYHQHEHGEIHATQSLSLGFSGNSVTVMVGDHFSPTVLRQVADEMEDLQRKLGAELQSRATHPSVDEHEMKDKMDQGSTN